MMGTIFLVVFFVAAFVIIKREVKEFKEHKKFVERMREIHESRGVDCISDSFDKIVKEGTNAS